MSRYDDRRDRHDDRRDRYDDRRDRFDDRRGSRNDDYGRGPPRDHDRDRYDRRDDRDRYDRYDRRDDRGRGRDRYDDRRGGGRGGGGRDRDWGRIPDRENTRLHIANLSKNARYDDLKGLFEKYGGRVLNIDIKEGFGFVEFDNPRGADDAKRQLDNYKYEGESMKISWAKGKKPAFAAKGRGDFRLRVEGLDKRTSWQDLKDFARHAGEVVYTDVWFDDGHKFGCVEYRTADEMETALRKLDGTTLDGSRVKLIPDKGASSSSSDRKTNSRSPPRGRSPDRGGDRDRDRDRSRSPRSPPPRSPADNSPVGRRTPPRSRSRTPPHSPDEAPRRNRSRTPE